MRALPGLLLPALLPSWRFFSAIAPSPRIEYATLRSARDQTADWQEFRPRPARLIWRQTITRLVHNPSWNEQLYLVALAERIIVEPTAHSIEQIHQRIARHLARTDPPSATHLQFRLVFVHRQGDTLARSVEYTSPAHEL